MLRDLDCCSFCVRSFSSFWSVVEMGPDSFVQWLGRRHTLDLLELGLPSFRMQSEHPFVASNSPSVLGVAVQFMLWGSVSKFEDRLPEQIISISFENAFYASFSEISRSWRSFEG